MAGAILFLWMVWKGKASFSLLLRKEMLFTGAALTFGTFAGLYWAEQHVSSGLAAVLSATGPMMILLLQTALFRQKLRRIRSTAVSSASPAFCCWFCPVWR